ncbi:MAG: ABC transporter permease [Clostridium sp.]
MLVKLMKYEFKATGRILIPLYAALLGFALINRILFSGSLDETISKTFGTLGSIANFISVFAYGCTMAAVFVVTFFVIVQRFYKNILGDEGYLMNTLPVKPSLNIINKILVSLIWTIVSCFIAFLSILILFATIKNITEIISNILPAFREIYNNYGGFPYLILFELFILGLIEVTKSITMIYASMSIGHLFNKSKILWSFASFIALNIIANIINSIFMFICPTLHLSVFISPSQGAVAVLFLIVILVNLIYFSLYFFITNYILKNKLNLE